MRVMRSVRCIICLAFLGCGSPRIRPNSGADAAGGGAAGGKAGSDIGFNLDALPPASDGASTGPGVGAGGAPPSCASETQKAEQAPVDLLLLVDTSGSMNESAGALSKWQLARGALQTFWKDARSAGLGMGLQFFPLAAGDRTCKAAVDCTGGGAPGGGLCAVRNVCAGATLPLPATACNPASAVCPAGTTCKPAGLCAVSGGDCLAPGTPCPTGVAGDTCSARGPICNNIGTGSCVQADYEALAVPITPLPGSSAPLTQAITVKEPIGFTPTGAAVAGALAALRRHLEANPTHKGVLVVMTDGLPLGCATNDAAAVTASITAARTASPPILTYAIGVFGAAQFDGPAALNQWAQAGGTGAAAVVSPGADFADKLLATLDTIRGAALPCEFTIPPPQSGSLDYGRVNVRYTGAGGASDVLYVGEAARCDPTMGGWYYDVDPKMQAPSRVLICPATCARYKGDPSAGVELVFGCATKVIL
jgi:hypothetical protein